MRILRIVQYFQPKIGYADYYLMNEFQKKGHKVCILTSNFNSLGTLLIDKTSSHLLRTGWNVEYGLTVYRLPSLLQKGELIINQPNVGQVLKDFKPDIVHSNDLFYLPTLLSLHYKKSLGYKVFVDSITGTFEPGVLDKLAFVLFKGSFGSYLRKNVDGFFAISKGSKTWLLKNFRVNESLIKIVHLGADSKMFAPNSSVRQIMRSKLGILNDEVALIYTGKIIPDKDINVLIKSLLFLSNTFQRKLKLIIVGSGSNDYVRQLIKLARPLGKSIFFIPTVDKYELCNYYNAADIAIWPGAPSISIIDAMSTGLPIIIAGYEKPREDAYDISHLLSNNNGLNFNRGNVVMLANSISALANNEQIRNIMGKRSRQLVDGFLSWDRISTKYLKLYVA